MSDYYTFLGQKVRSLNLEVTNRCYLGCSECARTMRPDLVKEPLNLPLNTLQSFLPMKEQDFIRSIKMNICGSFGDAVYHPQILEIVEYLRLLDCPIYIETNGSFKDVSFWRDLTKLLGKKNWLNFSVDGLSDTNHLYRKRARWNDITEAIGESVKWTNVRWKWIVFHTNEHQVEMGKEYAKKLGVHHFLVIKSDRFRDQDDQLLPVDKRWNSVVSQNKMLIKKLIASRDEDLKQVEIRPRCLLGKGLSVSSNGLFYPCQAYYTSSVWKSEKRELGGIDIRTVTLREALEDSHWEKLSSSWKCSENLAEACLRKCGVHQKFQDEYAFLSGRKDLQAAKPDVDNLIELNQPHYLLGDD